MHDKVPHRNSLTKCLCYGIKGVILGWITAFLGNRTYQVTVNGELSEFKKVTSGIPQGSVLGLLLFVWYLFADDTKIFREINGSDDHTTLQKDTKTMLNWADKQELQFHPYKCVSMSINTKTNHNESNKMHLTELKQVKQKKGIGVIVDDQLKFESHILEKN